MKQFLLLAAGLCTTLHAVDVNIVGFIDDVRSVSRHTTGFIRTLQPEIPIKLFTTRPCSLQDQPASFQSVVNNAIDITNATQVATFIDQHTALKGITIYADTLLYEGWNHYSQLPNNSTIRIAHCVTERTLIPQEWAQNLNQNFDALVVPDTWLIDVYKNSGVTLPVFVLPLVLDLDALLAQPLKSGPSNPFTFGFTGGFWERKNQKLLIRAFYEEFGNNKNVALKIHGRFESSTQQYLEFLIRKTNISNIFIEQKAFNRCEYESFLTSLDCYVTASKGEGFSIVPREALAAGIPCILSNNTAQRTICQSGFVCSIPSDITEPSYCSWADDMIGVQFNCSLTDVRKALRDVYTNYEQYKLQAIQGREWARQYTVASLKNAYMTLVAPTAIVLGSTNSVTNGILTTDSKTLFDKFKKLYPSAVKA